MLYEMVLALNFEHWDACLLEKALPIRYTFPNVSMAPLIEGVNSTYPTMQVNQLSIWIHQMHPQKGRHVSPCHKLFD